MSTHYQIQIEGYLDQRWADWFEPLKIAHQPGGQTLLSGPLRDQAELHGVLNKLRDLNLVLIAVQTVDQAHKTAPKA